MPWSDVDREDKYFYSYYNNDNNLYPLLNAIGFIFSQSPKSDLPIIEGFQFPIDDVSRVINS